MFGALLYLRLTSLKNWLRMRLLRLKQPKYLAGAVVGVAYFWFFFFRRSFSGGSGARRQSLQQASQALEAAGVTLPGQSADLGLAIGATLLICVRETEAILASASPRKPKLPTASKSSSVAILLVA